MKTHQAFLILVVIINVSASSSPIFHKLSQSSITHIRKNLFDDSSSEIKKLDTAGRSRTTNETTIMRLTDSQINELQTNYNSSFNDAEIKMSFNESKFKEQISGDKLNETNPVHKNISGRSKNNNESTSTIHVWSSNSLTNEQWEKIQKNVEENKDLLHNDSEYVKTDFEKYDNRTSKIVGGRNEKRNVKENDSEEPKYYSFSKTEWDELKQNLYKNQVDEDEKILKINETSNNTKHQGRSRSIKNESSTFKGLGLWNSYALKPSEWNQLKENIHDNESNMNVSANNNDKIGRGRSKELDSKSNGHNDNYSAKDKINVVIVKPITGEKLYNLNKHVEWDKLLEGISSKNPNATNEDTVAHGKTEEPTPEPENTEETTTDHANTKEPTTDHGNTEYPTTDHGNTEEPTTDHGNTEEPTTDHVNTEEPTTVHANTEEPTTVHANTEEPITVHANKEEPTTVHANKEETTTDHANKEEPTTVHANKEETTTVHANTEEPTTDHVNTEEPTTDHVNTEEPTNVHANKEEPTTVHANKEEPTTVHANKEEPTTVHANKEETTTDHANTEEPTTDHANTEETTTNHANTEETTTDHANTEETTTDHGNIEEPTTDHANTEEPTTDHANTEELMANFTKNGKPCILYDGIPAVCDYHGQDYIWCWTTDTWDYCNDTVDHGNTEEPTPEPENTEEPTTDHANTEEPTTDHANTEEPTTDHANTEEPTTDHANIEKPMANFTKNGKPCILYDGIPAVCDYHGQDYIWCWTTDTWDYCNVNVDHGNTEESAPEPENTEESTTDHGNTEETTTDHGNTEEPTTDHANTEEPTANFAKNGKPCILYDGIPAVCDYHGQDYIWCWTTDTWDYCNGKDGNTKIDYNEGYTTQGYKQINEKMQLGRQRHINNKLEGRRIMQSQMLSDDDDFLFLLNNYPENNSSINENQNNFDTSETSTIAIQENNLNIQNTNVFDIKQIPVNLFNNSDIEVDTTTNVPIVSESFIDFETMSPKNNINITIITATEEYITDSVSESTENSPAQINTEYSTDHLININNTQLPTDAPDNIFRELNDHYNTLISSPTSSFSDNFTYTTPADDSSTENVMQHFSTNIFVDDNTVSLISKVNSSQDNFIINVSVENDHLGNDPSTSTITLLGNEYDSATESITEPNIINVSVENDQLGNDHSTTNIALKEYDTTTERTREKHIINVSVENDELANNVSESILTLHDNTTVSEEYDTTTESLPKNYIINISVENYQLLNDNSTISITLQDSSTSFTEYETVTESMQSKDTEFSNINEKDSSFTTNAQNIDEKKSTGIYDGTAQDVTTNTLNEQESEYTAISDGTTAYDYIITSSNNDFIINEMNSNENTKLITNVIHYGSSTSDDYGTTPLTSDTMSTELLNYVTDNKSLDTVSNMSLINLLKFATTEDYEGTLMPNITSPETLNVTEILLGSVINSEYDLFDVDNSSSPIKENISTSSQTTDEIINSNSNENSGFSVNESITNSVMDSSSTTNSFFSFINNDNGYIMKEERFDFPEEPLLQITTESLPGNSDVSLPEITKDIDITTPTTDNFNKISEDFSTTNSEALVTVLLNSNSIVDLIIDEQSVTTVQPHNNVNDSFNMNNSSEDPMIYSIDVLGTTIIASSSDDISEIVPLNASSDVMSKTKQNEGPTQAMIYSTTEKLSNNLPNQPQELVGNEIPKTTSTARPTTVPTTPVKPVAHKMETWIILLIVCILSLIFLVGGIIIFLRIARRHNGHFQLSP